jgi:Na+/H+ antiporter NhaA
MKANCQTKDALLPIFAALGGMLVPAGIYLCSTMEVSRKPEQVSLWLPISLLHWESYPY